MDCVVARESMSAELDGEETPISSDLVAAHFSRCDGCRSWESTARALHRKLRLTVAQEVPELTPSILAAIGADDQRNRVQVANVRACRSMLMICAVLQLAMTLPIFFGSAPGPIHLDHELGSWDAALSAGLLVAAFRPERAWGMLPLVGAIGAALTATGAYDVMANHTSLTGETTHIMELVGLSFLWALARLQRDRATAPSPRLA